MGVTYLQGGDAYQKLDHPIWAGQTFRPSESFTLQWVDLNLKLSGRRPQALVSVWHAGVDHLPSGYILSLSSHWLINQPLIHRDWLWFEPWGKTLDENHFWLDQPPLEPPTITLKNGTITLVNTGRTAQWIDTLLSTTPFPLVDGSGKHLYFHHCSPISLGHPVNHWHSYTFKTEKDGDLWTLEAIISNGTQWPPWNTTCGTTPLGSCFYCGQGPQVFDFTEWWIHCRNCLELDPDPTGWTLSHLQLRIEDTEAAPGGTLQNNFCGISREPHTPVPFDDYNVLPSGYSLPNRLYRVRFKMKEVLLEADSYYFIRVCVFTTLLDSPHYWQYDKGDASYPSGIRLSSNNGGASWDKHFDDDHLFAAFGTPTVPSPPPEPPIANWAILDVEQTITATGIKFVVTTNTPVHLSMFWTNQEPQKHERTTIVRGLTVPAAVAYCFVVWNQNEQDEPGDTLFHTFVKEPWAICETRWFTFRALVNKDWSPSVGPIFTKHRLAMPPPQFYKKVIMLPNWSDLLRGSGLKDTTAEAFENSWSGDGTEHLHKVRVTTPTCHIRPLMGRFYCNTYRSLIHFELELPEGTIIREANIIIQDYDLVQDPTDHLDVVSANSIPYPGETEYYQLVRDKTTVVGHLDISQRVKGGLYTIPWDPDRLDLILPDVQMAIAFRVTSDTTHTEPPTWGVAWSLARACYLEVWYDLPA